MEILEGCLPCLFAQAQRAAKIASNSKETEQKVLNLAKEILSNYKDYENAPHLAQAIYKAVEGFAKEDDPFKEIKKKDIYEAKELVPVLKDFISGSENTLYAALKVGAVGNNLDSAVVRNIDIKECIKEELQRPFTVCDIDVLKEKLKTAKTVLIVGDNSGEAVFDGVFMDNFPNLTFYYAVRSAPIINDITLAEVPHTNIDKKAQVFASGSCAPGSVLSQCSEKFKAILKESDIVISKGQGNFESLSEVKNIFFLLKTKCPVIASRFGVETGSYVFKYNK